MNVLKRMIAVICLVVLCFSCFEASAKSPEIQSEAAILIDAKSGQILYEKNKDQKLYPASITKIMTLYLASQSGKTGIVTASETAVDAVSKDSSNIAIDYGEQLSLEQLMYAAQLMSANDACTVIAEHVSGSIGNFVALMNKTAKQMGTRNTNFANTNGLSDANHYTTAYDFAVITQNAIKDEGFMKVFSSLEYTIPPTNKKNESRNMYAQHRMMHQEKYSQLGVIGGKAGYTADSKHTLVTYAEKNGISVIVVVLKGDFDTVYGDTEKLLKYAYDSFESVTITDKDIAPKVDKLTTYTPKGSITFWNEKNSKKNFTYVFSDKGVDVVSDSGEIVGTLGVEVSVKTPVWKTVLKVILWIIGIFFGFIFFLYILLVIKTYKKRKRRKALAKKYK